MNIFLYIIVLLLLLISSAFFSGTEAAITSLPNYRIKKILLLEKKLSRPLLYWMRYPQYLLTTILIGNTIVNIFVSAVATLVALLLFSAIIRRIVIEILSFVVITIVVLLFGEILPKIYSKNNPEKVTRSTIHLLYFISRALYPIVVPIVQIMNKVIPCLENNLSPLDLTEEELQDAFLDSVEKGVLEKGTYPIVTRVLRFDKLKVKEVMNKHIDMVDIEKSDFVDKIIDMGHTRTPVCQKDKIVGYVFLRDILFNLNITRQHLPIRELLVVQQETKLSEIFQKFQTGLSHIALVVDSSNRSKGIITLEDVLEEIVGEILDEYDSPS